MITLATIFVVIAAILCLAALLALLGIGHLGLSGPDALARDGLARGQPAPAWTLEDSAGVPHSCPPSRPLQLIVFADHSLKSFPSVVTGLRALLADEDLEIVILTRGPAGHAEPVLHQLGLAGVPVLTGSPASYGRCNVRVMPFAIFVDSAGRVRASSLVNHDWQLAKLRQVAAIPVGADEVAGRRRKPAMAG
ncbi:MAG TPA: hypothetical protein VMU94_18265 [Streptosporangiaceae bacterium]|nr:hypothetical protein [Streptosporangiaceae bacterium]